MKLVMFRKTGDPRFGCLVEHEIVDLNLAYEALLESRGKHRACQKAALMVPPETIQFLEGGDESLQAAREALAWVASQQVKALQVRGLNIVSRLDEVKLLAPIAKPSKIICAAHNYHDFLKELGMQPHKEPRLFAKYANAVAAYDDPIPRPAMTICLG